MLPMIKEVTSGFGSALIFIVLLTRGMPWWLGLFLAASAYFGIRVLFPPDTRKIQVVLPEDISRQEFREFMGLCGINLAGVRELAEDIGKVEFRNTVYRLCERCDELMASFEKDPGDIKIAAAFPDRLGRLRDMLETYNELAGLTTQSEQTRKALATTERAVAKALDKFEELHHRLLENNALDLSTNAKTFDNLLDLD